MTRPKLPKTLAMEAEKMKPVECTGHTGVCPICRTFIMPYEVVIWYPAEKRLEHKQCLPNS